MLDVMKVELFGPVGVSIGGADVGHTDEKGVTVEVKGQFVEAFAGKYGKAAPVQQWLNGQSCEVTLSIIQTENASLVNVLPGAALVTGVGGTKLTFGRGAGYKLTGVTMILTPYPSGQSPKFNFTLKRVVPIGDFNIVYSGDGFNLWACKFRALIDEATGAEGSFLARFGDDSITPDVVVPTISAVVPADNAPAIPVGTAVNWTASENLDASSVSTATVHLLKNPAGGPTVKVVGVVALVNAGASTQITFTPSAPLTAASPYLAILDGVKDVAGNPLAFYASDFTTA